LIEQLAIRGKLLIPVGPNGNQEIVLLEK